MPRPPEGYVEAFNAYRFDAATATLWQVISRLNRDIERVRPWKALKSGEPTSLKEPLSRWLHELHKLGYWLAPLLPKASGRILQALLQGPIRTQEALFPRIE
jgi:methionyl-tRNA synthetase